VSLPIEDRLRAHFAERSALETLPTGDHGLPPRRIKPSWQRPVLVAVAAAGLVVVAIATSVAVVNISRNQHDVAAPGDIPPTTSVVVAVQGVMGGWDGSAWASADQIDAPSFLHGGEQYWVLGLDQSPTRGTGSPPRSACPSVGSDGQRVDVPGLERSADPLAPMPIAVTGVTDPVPRPTSAVLTGTRPYRDIAVDALADYGVTDPDPPLVQLYRTDFEGDGVDEVLIVAERLQDPVGLAPAEGDYSIMLVHRTVDGTARTVLVSGWRYSGGPGRNIARVSAVADLNGDGVMELVVDSRFTDRTATSVLTVGTTIETVLTTTCG